MFSKHFFTTFDDEKKEGEWDGMGRDGAWGTETTEGTVFNVIQNVELNGRIVFAAIINSITKQPC